MDSNANVVVHTVAGNEFLNGEASSVTVSGHVDRPTLGFLNDSIPNTVTCAADANLLAGNTQKRPTLCDFVEEIRRLEIEGDKLRAVTASNLGYLNGLSLEANDYESPKLQSFSLANLSPMSDILPDQVYISELRAQLEKQSKETDRLQKQLFGDIPFVHSASAPPCPAGSSFSNSLVLGPSKSPDKPAFSAIPSSTVCRVFGHQYHDYEPPPHLERSLKESQEQVMELRKKLQEATESSELQKKQFRLTVEDLKSKLHDTILNRDTVLDLRQKESNTQELLISKLQSSLTQLQEHYRQQEEILASTSKKLDMQNQNVYLNETALTQLRHILMEQEKRRGQAFFETDPVSGQSVTMLVRTLERCLQELDHEVTVKSSRVSELESDIKETKIQAEEREKTVAREYREMLEKEIDEASKRISLMRTEHENGLADITEAAAVAREQVTALQNQIQENEVLSQQKLATKELEIKALENKINELQTDNLRARTVWQEKLIEATRDQVTTERLRQALESSLDQVQRELMEAKLEKNEVKKSKAVLESQLQDLQSLVSRHESDLETERDRIQQQRLREEDLRSQVMALETQVTNKQGDIDRLEKMLELVKQECSLTLSDSMANAEKLERDKYLDQIRGLSTQLITVTERYNRVTTEQQIVKNEMDSCRLQVHDLTGKLERARSQLESALAEKQDLITKLGDKCGDLDRLCRDKEHYTHIAKQRADEITELKITADRLMAQLGEKESILSTFRQQSSSISQLTEVSTKAHDSIRDEKEKLVSALAERTAQAEELKASQDSLCEKVKAGENRIRDLECERLKAIEELAVKNQEIELLHKEKENIFKELKESRMEVANLISSKDAQTKEISRAKAYYSKEINKLQAKLKDSDQCYKLSQKALRSKDIVDHKGKDTVDIKGNLRYPVKFADKIQKEITVKRSEIDQLTFKLHRMEEKLETVTKEKALIEKDKENLKKSLAKTLLCTQKLTDDLQYSESKNKELVAQVALLEEELEQAVLRASAAHSVDEKREQEIATLKLKHQLDLKEAKRLASTKGGSTLSYNIGSSVLSYESAGQQQNDSDTGRKEDSKESLILTSATPLPKKSPQMEEAKQRDYNEVGKELRSLLADMRNLITSHREDPIGIISFPSSNGKEELDRNKMKMDKDLNIFISSQPEVQETRSDQKTESKNLQAKADLNKSWATRSLTGLADLSDFTSYKEWRPRSSSFTRSHRPTSADHDMSTSFLSKGGYSSISMFSQSPGSPQKPKIRNSTVPDTQELCKRLEQKIVSLTLMGSNLVKENKEMAELIDLQGEKLSAVKQMERNTREPR